MSMYLAVQQRCVHKGQQVVVPHLHRVGLSGTGLTVREYTDVESVDTRYGQSLHLVKDLQPINNIYTRIATDPLFGKSVATGIKVLHCIRRQDSIALFGILFLLLALQLYQALTSDAL